VVNASGRSELGAAVKRRLEELGFVVVDVSENGTPRLAETIVRYSPGQLAKAKLALRYFEALPALDPAAADLGATPTGAVDVEIRLGRNFRAIAVPADSSTIPGETLPATEVTAPAGAVDGSDLPAPTPSTTPSTTLPASLPAPAPRGSC
jgi:hypothetical protein